MWFFRPDHRQLQRLYLADFVEEGCLPASDLVHSQCTEVSEGSFSQRLRCPGPSCSSHVHIPSPGTFVLGLFIWGLGMRSSSGTYAEVEGRGGETFRRHFYSLWLSPSPFPLLAFLPPLTLDPRVHKIEEAFVQGPSVICADPFDPQPVCHSIRKNGTRGVGASSHFRLLLISHSKWLKA